MEIWTWLVEFSEWLWAFTQVKFLLAHISLNVVVAIATSIYIKEFRLGKTGEFLYRKVLPYLLVFGAFAGLGEAANMGVIASVAFISLEAMLLGDLLDNLRKLGLPIPQSLTQPTEWVVLEAEQVDDFNS